MPGEKKQVKIGSRVLSKEAFNILLPNNKEIFTRIENIRKFASANSKYIDKNKCKSSYIDYLNREFERNNNNVFSILGGRGSGKTSVLLTIKNKLTNDIMSISKNDIMMPLIIPENMGDSSDVLGWTICAFEKVIKDIEKYVYDNRNYNNCYEFDFFKNCRKNDNNILREKFGELLKYYTYINKDYRQILNLNYDGFKDYKDKTKEVVNAERELLNKFEEFIDILIAVKKYIYENEEEPLIYIFFDDVDLCTERCLEIINIIQKYLSNSNIVVFVSGDYGTFTETITINLLKKDGLLEKCEQYFDKEKNALEARKQLAQDILKKVFPPAYRFKLHTFNNEAKSKFKFSQLESYNKEENDDQYESLVELIISKLLGKDKYDTDNFLYYNGDLIKIYFNIFDSNPRSLMNIYYFLHEIDESKENKNDSEILKSFLNIIIYSNPQLVNIADEIVTYIIDIKDSLKDTFINYEYIREMYYNQFEVNSKSNIDDIPKDKLNKYINLFLLAHFIENIITTKINVKRNVHGIDIFIEIVDLINKNKLIPKHSNSKFILALYSKVDEDLGKMILNKFNSENINYFTKTYFEIVFDLVSNESKEEKVINHEKIEDIFLDSIRKNDNWAKEKIDIIFEATSTTTELFYNVINKVYDEYIKKLYSQSRIQIIESIKELKINFDEGNNNKLISEITGIEEFNFDKKYPNEFISVNEVIRSNLDLNEIISEIKKKTEDIEVILKHNSSDGVVYKINSIFIESFNRIVREFSYEDDEKISDKLRKIEEIIANSKSGEINKIDYKELTAELRALRILVRRQYSIRIAEEFDFLYQIVIKFEYREVIMNENIDDLIFKIKQSILTKFAFEFFNRKKYIYENKESYNKFELMKAALEKSTHPGLKERVIHKQKELIELKLEEEDSNNV